MAPVLPLLARSLGLAASDLGLVTAANSLARIACNIPMAAAAERYGRRPLLILGPAVGACGFALLGCSHTFYGLSIWNALAGAGGAATMAGAGLYLNDISTPRNRARTTAPLMVTALIGFSLGPALGGFLGQQYGLQSPFFVCSAGMALAALSSVVLLPETQRSVQPAKGAVQQSIREQWTRLLSRPELQGIMGLMVFQGFAQGAGPVTSILVASEHLGMSPTAIGGLFTANVVVMAATMPFVARLSDRTPNRLRLIVPGVLINCAAFALQASCTAPEHFFALGLVGALGSAFVMPNVSAYVIDCTAAQERAQALAMRQMAQDLGVLVGASLMGVVSSMVGAPLAMQIAAGVQAAAAGFCAARAGMGPKRPGSLRVQV